MKKLIAMLLVLTMVLSFAACAKKDAGMSHADYMAAANDTEVVVETYVQAHQSWWDNKVTVYCQSPDGAYFLYELACSEEDAAKLVPGTKIRVTGYKSEWSGEVEITDGTFEFVKGDSYIAEPLDVTDLLGTDELIDHQNEFVSFTGLTVAPSTDANGNEISVRSRGNNQYTFTMPRSRVTIEATFAEIEEEPDLFFVDVPTSAYYYDAVYWAAENGVTYGTSATTFSPDVIVSRAQMVTFLWRAHGSPAPRSSVNPFTDVSSSAYYYDAVLWAVENGVTNGTSATTFSPDATVTRAQAVTFQWRAAGSPAVSGGSFADVADSAYYAGAVSWAVANGVTNGTGGSNFSPDVGVSRAQAVTFLWRQLA